MLMNESLLISFVVVFCSICQSVIGVGLVMIGIPTLILCGFSFAHALSICLPGSLIINLLQVGSAHKKISRNDLSSYLIMSAVYLGFLFYVNYSLGISFDKLTAGSILILTGIVGFRASLRESFLSILTVNPVLTNIMTGVIHAISTMGGSVLSLSGAARYEESASSRRFIAGGYLSLVAICRLGLFSFSSIYHTACVLFRRFTP